MYRLENASGCGYGVQCAFSMLDARPLAKRGKKSAEQNSCVNIC